MSRIAIHTITNKPWNLAQCAKNYAAAKIGGVTLWRHHFATNSPAEAGRILCDAGLVCTGLARAGFFPAQIPADRKTGIEDTRRAIDEAAGCGAPILVLVCGAVPGIPLTEARRQICDGIASCLPDARAAGVKLAIEPLHPMYVQIVPP